MEQGFDLVLKGGRVIDPAQDLDGIHDVAIAEGKIAAVAPELSGGATSIDVRGALVLPGLIDTHAHVFRHVTGRFGLDADLVGTRSGVTALVDQGGPSLMTFPAFRSYVVEPAATRVYAFLSAYLVGGMEGPLLPRALRPARHRCRWHGQGGARQPRSRQGDQGACRDRRLLALGHGGVSPSQRDLAPDPPAALHPFRPALAIAGR